MEHVDVIIVGAGLSGIGAAVHLKKGCPGKIFILLESRNAAAGTWDLFRYPGIRSDSDMHTLGYSFKPWTEAKAIADGPAIRKYVNETADEYGIREHIRFGHHVDSATWNSKKAQWIISCTSDGRCIELSANFLFMCGGYYSYEHGYLPEFDGSENFKGQVIHPQFWPEDLDYAGKRVLVIGSGATAMTLVPAMAEQGASVTMVQRSPTYVVSRPAEDSLANTLRRWLPAKWAYAITRFKNVTLSGIFYRRMRTHPKQAKENLLKMVRAEIGDEMVEKHFTPSYNPWDQRMCLIPDGDLYKSINNGTTRVVTAQIDQWTEKGLKLDSGEELEADIIVTATGLQLEVMSGIKFNIDNRSVNFPDTFTYKGMMYSGLPNMAHTFGYINASWTLRADLTAEYVCHLLNHMDATGQNVVTPTLRQEDEGMQARDWIEGFSSGYMQRMMHLFPKQGNDPWRNTQNYKLDKAMIRHAPIADDALVFNNVSAQQDMQDTDLTVQQTSRAVA